MADSSEALRTPDQTTHDLRNAAASIYGCARTLLDSAHLIPDATRTELLNVIIAQSAWIGHAVEDS